MSSHDEDTSGHEVEVHRGQVVDLAAARSRRLNHDGASAPATSSTEQSTPAAAESADREVPSGTVVVPERPRPRREIVPPWVRDRAAVTATLRWGAGYGMHVGIFHTVRLPVYSLRIAARSPIGAGRATAAIWRWVFDADTRETRRVLMAQATDSGAFLRLVEDRRRQTRRRSLVVASVGVLLAIAGVTVALTADPLVQLASVVALVVVLGLMGRKADQRITGRAMDSAQVPALTQDTITDALSTLGIGSITTALRNDPRAVRYLSIVRDGHGFRADIDLPPGSTAGEVIDRRSKLASGLRRPLGQVWPEAAPEVHEGRLVLYVADRSLSEAKPAPWPLVKTGKANVFEPVPIGTDQRGRPVVVTLMFAAGLIGAIPRMGKTATLRLLLLAAALDPRVQIYAYNLKGGPDLDALEGVAHAYHSGEEPADMETMLHNLRELKAEMRRRYAVLRKLPKDVCPESKVTDDLSSDRGLKLHPVMLAVDETQVMFEHPAYGSEYEEIVTDLVKRGPAVGIMVWLATQRPDARSIPTGISANAVLRVCLKVMGQTENDMVLGTSAYKNGTRATMFGRNDLGIAILAGEGDDPMIVRTYYVDGVAAETVAARARAVRHAQGRLTGLAAGEDNDQSDESGSVLDHLLAVWPEDEPRVWCDTLAERLAASRPGLYDGWNGSQVTSAVKPHGVRTVQTKRQHEGQIRNRRGLARADITEALSPLELPPELHQMSDDETTGNG